MGNKVLRFKSSQESTVLPNGTPKKNTYVDISMDSAPNTNQEPKITDDTYKLFVMLAQEHPFERVGTDLVLTEREKDMIKLYYGIDYASFQRDYKLFLLKARYKIDSKVDVKAVQGSIHNIFTWIPGERILNPEFGSNLRLLLYEGITKFNTERIMAEIRHCVSEWEPRVQIEKVVNVGTVDDTEDNTVHLEVLYTIKGLDNSEVYSEPIVYSRS